LQTRRPTASLTHMFLRSDARISRSLILAISIALAAPLGSGCRLPVAVPNPLAALVQPGTTPSHADLAGIENAYQLGPRLWSGGEPHGNAAFAALAAAGVRTVVSVDGARPDIEAAHRHGLQYVHIPIGYDGVPPQASAALASLAVPRTHGIFVHCHHGKHRGPTAAALVARATGVWDASTAEAWLKLAGTSPDYPGLYRSVREFQMPDAPAVLTAAQSLKPIVAPKGIVDSMVQIDGLAEALTDMRVAGWKPIPAAPDETPVQVARLLLEQFREGLRLHLGPSEPAFFEAMKNSESAAAELESALRKSDKPASDAAWKRIQDSCTSCHRQWRNNR
jgi:hypothetical protein